MGSDDGSLSVSDSEGSYVPSLASDSGGEDEELEEGMKGSTGKKRNSGVARKKPNPREKPNPRDSKKNAQREPKVCCDSIFQVFCLY